MSAVAVVVVFVLVLTMEIEALVSTAPVASVTVPWIAAYTFCARATAVAKRHTIEIAAVAKSTVLNFIFSPHVIRLDQRFTGIGSDPLPYFHAQETLTQSRFAGQITAF